MQVDTIRRLFRVGGWCAVVVGLGFFAYSIYALVVGEVVLASRYSKEIAIPASVGWPFAFGVGLYLMGAGIFFWIGRKLLSAEGK